MSKFTMKSKHTNSKKPLLPFVSPFLSPSIQRPENNSSMDWSTDIPVSSTSLLLCVPPTSKYILLPHDLLHNIDSSSKIRVKSGDSAPTLLNYGNKQLAITNFWDGAFHVVSIFGTEKTWSEDTANIHKSIKRIISYIKSHLINKNLPSRDFILVVKSLWKLINKIYVSRWNVLIFDKKVFLTIQKCVGENIMPIYRKQELVTSNLTSNSVNLKGKSTISNPITALPSMAVSSPSTTNLPVVPLSNKIIESVDKKAPKPLNMRKSYMQASKANILFNIKDVLYVKEAFPTLSVDEVRKMLKAKNSRMGNKKPKINITTRRPSRKEVIIPIAKSNTELIINSAHIHISNVNKCLKNSKSDIVANLI